MKTEKRHGSKKVENINQQLPFLVRVTVCLGTLNVVVPSTVTVTDSDISTFLNV